MCVFFFYCLYFIPFYFIFPDLRSYFDYHQHNYPDLFAFSTKSEKIQRLKSETTVCVYLYIQITQKYHMGEDQFTLILDVKLITRIINL